METGLNKRHELTRLSLARMNVDEWFGLRSCLNDEFLEEKQCT